MKKCLTINFIEDKPVGESAQTVRRKKNSQNIAELEVAICLGSSLWR